MIYDRKLRTITFTAAETKIDGYTYEIDLDRIQSSSDLLKWIVHLSPKLWTTKGMLLEFATRVNEIKKIPIYGL